MGNTDAPDPPAQRMKEQQEYHFAFEQGEMKLRGERSLDLEQEELTPRRMGRFAVELFLGPELVERVRFDFPLLGGDGSPASLENGLRTDARVLVPRMVHATRARLLDRKTRQQLDLPWPPASERVPARAGASVEEGEPAPVPPASPR